MPRDVLEPAARRPDPCAPIGVVRAVTYNVHGCVGLDGRESVGRVAAVLGGLSADVIAVQELLQHPDDHRGDQAATLASRLGMQLAFAEAMPRGRASYGIALLLRDAPERVAVHRLPRPAGAEPRVALEASVGGITVVTTHWGLGREERLAHARGTGEKLPERGPMLVLGDFNCGPGSPPARWLRRALGLAPMPATLRTFPSPFPLLPIDYALARELSFRSVRALGGRLARVASDHLPVVVEVSA